MESRSNNEDNDITADIIITKTFKIILIEMKINNNNKDNNDNDDDDDNHNSNI